MKIIKDIDDFLLSEDERLDDILSRMETGAEGILLVVDSKNSLLGTITDGDIRRAILKGINFNEPIDKAYFRSPKALTANNYSKKEALKIMINKIE